MTAQYWTITGNDMWRLVERKVFDFKNLNTGEIVTCDCVTEVTGAKFLPVTMPKIKPRTPKVKKDKVKTERSSRRGQQPRTKYKGVRVSGKKFMGQYWDKEKKKLIHLGTFDSELLAAAAVQKALGNNKEAQRLQNEYQEGNCGSEASEPSVVHERKFSEDKPNPAIHPSEQ